MSNRKSIDGKTYEVSPFPCKKGLRILTQLIKMIGPAVTALGETKNVMAMVGQLGQSLDPDQVCTLAEEFSEYILIVYEENRKPTLKSEFEIHFRGRYGAMLEVLSFAIEVNYGSFLDALKPKASEHPDPTASP